MTVPDYTLLIVTGVTVALAWGLPFEPTYPEDELMDQYQNGTLPLISRKDEKVHKYTNKSKKKPTKQSTATKPNYNQQHLLNMFQKFYNEYPEKYNSISYNYGNKNNNYYGLNYNKQNNSIIRDRYYFGQRYSVPNRMNFQSVSIPSSSFGAKNGTARIGDRIINGKTTVRHPIGGNRLNAAVTGPLTTNHFNNNPYTEFAKYLTQTYFKPWQEAHWAERTTRKTTKKPRTSKSTTTEFRPIIRKLHTIYPAMGKRSIVDDSATYEDKFYIDYHRKTRHDLFKLIEKYISAKGFNGSACVLKTLCEVGQRRDDEQPGSFLTEIIRAVFSVPMAQLKPPTNHIHQGYDHAHNFGENCGEMFSDCSESIWDAGFLMGAIK